MPTMIPNINIFGGSVSSATSKQIVARVLQFDGTNFTFLTHSFFPFVNHDSTGALTQAAPALSIGTRKWQ